METLALEALKTASLPLIVFAASIVITCWLVREIKQHSNWGQTITSGLFLLLFGVLSCSLAGYTVWTSREQIFPHPKFTDSDPGVAIFKFKNDKDGSVHDLIKHSTTSNSDFSDEYPTLEIVSSAALISSTKQAVQLCPTLKAVVCIWGTVVRSQAFIYIVRVGDESRVGRAAISIDSKPNIIAAAIKNELDTFRLSQTVMPRDSTVSETEELLRKKVSLLEKRVKELQSPLATDIILTDSFRRTNGEYLELQRKREALLIGVGSFDNSDIPAISADNDPSLIDSTFRDIWPEYTSNVLSGSKGTKSNIWQKLLAYRDKLEPDSQALIYLSGHAVLSDDGDAYLLPYDANPDSLEETGISFGDLTGWFESLQVQQSILIVDTCYAEKIIPIAARGIDRTVHPRQNSTGKAYFAASSRNGLAFETSDGSAFTNSFVKGLKGAADLGSDGVVNAREMNTYIQYDITRTNFKQNPAFYRSVTSEGQFVLSIAPERNLVR